jgi:hypothetical protein
MKSVVAFTLITASILVGCKEKSKKSQNQEILPKAMGEIGKVALLIDDVTYASSMRDIDSIYKKPLEGMPGAEPYYKTVRCRPSEFTKYFKHNYNLCIVYQKEYQHKLAPALGEELTKLMQEKLKNGETVFVLKDVFARPQEVTVILANDEADLKSKLKKNSKKLFDLAKKTERKTSITQIVRGSDNDDVFYNRMMDNFGYGVRTPGNFRLSVSGPDFNGIKRTYSDDRALGLYLYEEPFEGEHQFTSSYIIERRNEVLKQYIHGPDRLDSVPTYMSTDTKNVELFKRSTTINGLKAVELRGWWEMKNDFFGGPFVSYTVYCPKQNKVVTIETNVFAPGKKKQELLRQLELAASTFEEKQ